VVTLVATGLISNSEMLQQEGPLEGTCHPPHFLQWLFLTNFVASTICLNINCQKS